MTIFPKSGVADKIRVGSESQGLHILMGFFGLVNLVVSWLLLI